jgi:polyhydroxyalkanoate synthesis repressor PhaR
MPHAPGDPRVIKRYSNRKLYDTRSSQYVTLEQIAEMIRQGEEVRVLDNSSKEDLTSVTLAQIIFEEEKRQKSFIPLGAMRQLIQSGGASLQELAQQAQARVLSVFRPPREGGREREDGDEGSFAQDADAARAADLARADLAAASESLNGPGASLGAAAATDEGRRAESTHRVRELFDRSQQTLEEWQRRVDERVRHIVDSLSPFAGLEKEVAQLSLRVEALEKQLGKQPSPAGSPAASPTASSDDPPTAN